MSTKINVDSKLREKVEITAKEVNELINKGKENIYGDKSKEFIDKHNINDLLMLGCKLHKLPSMQYLELPKKEISEDKIESVLFSISQIM